MGGGDSLYDKIDKGIRGCKVMLSCVTTKYSLSPNCRREVSLADAIRKPIIPLLLEAITWPPEGAMSMPFTQLLYVNFCNPDIEVQNHWNVPQFDELLEKVKGYVSQVDFQTATNAKKTETTNVSEMKKASINTGNKQMMPLSSNRKLKATTEDSNKNKQDNKYDKVKAAGRTGKRKEKTKEEIKSETHSKDVDLNLNENNPQPKAEPFYVTPSQKRSSACLLM